LEEGKSPSSNSTRKRLYVMNLGKSWKGGEAPFPVDCHPERSEGVSNIRGGKMPLLELHPKHKGGDPSERYFGMTFYYVYVFMG